MHPFFSRSFASAAMTAATLRSTALDTARPEMTMVAHGAARLLSSRVHHARAARQLPRLRLQHAARRQPGTPHAEEWAGARRYRAQAPGPGFLAEDRVGHHGHHSRR